eukprot:95285_1
MSTALSSLHVTFEQNHPFESFASNETENEVSRETITRRINHHIIQVLNAIIEDDLALDVAFIKINLLVYYATCTINTVIPGASDEIFIEYYHFLFYFMMFGCCLGTKFKESMIVPHQNNDLLRCFIDKYKSNNWPRRIKYAYCASQREAIIDSICGAPWPHACHYDIALLIADFTSFEFEEFFNVATSYCFNMVSAQINDAESQCTKKQMAAFWYTSFGFSEGSALFIMPKLLLCPSFIDINCSVDLTYFANEMLFKCIWWTPHTKHYKWIRNIFANHVTIQPWHDAKFFIELFEEYKRKYGEDAMLRVLEQSITRQFDMNFCSYRALCIFFDGRFCRLKENDVDIHQDIEILFNDFVVQYGTKNKNILSKLYHQILSLEHQGIKQANGNELLQAKVTNMTRLLMHYQDYQQLLQQQVNVYYNGIYFVNNNNNNHALMDVDDVN